MVDAAQAKALNKTEVEQQNEAVALLSQKENIDRIEENVLSSTKPSVRLQVLLFSDQKSFDLKSLFFKEIKPRIKKVLVIINNNTKVFRCLWI